MASDDFRKLLDDIYADEKKCRHLWRIGCRVNGVCCKCRIKRRVRKIDINSAYGKMARDAKEWPEK